MKNLNSLLYLLIACSIIFSSCTIDKRQHLAGYHIVWKGKGKEKMLNKTTEEPLLTSHAAIGHKDESFSEADERIAVEEIMPLEQVVQEYISETNLTIESKVTTLAAKSDDGSNKKNQIKLHCKADSNIGQISTVQDEAGGRMNGTAIVAFAFAIAGLFVFAVVFGAVAVILGGVALSHIYKSDTGQRGKGFGFFGMIIGVIDIVAGLYILSIL